MKNYNDENIEMIFRGSVGKDREYEEEPRETGYRGYEEIGRNASLRYFRGEKL